MDRSGSEVSAPSPLPQQINVVGRSSLRLWLLYRVSPMRHRVLHIPQLSPVNYAAHPFRGLFPFSVLPVARSHLCSVSFHLTDCVASLGFRTPSTPCSPRGLPGLSHPGSALGIFPSRPFSPRNAVRSLERHDPHTVGYDVNVASPPQGFTRSEGPARVSRGLVKNTAGCPLGIVPLRGFLPYPLGANRIIKHPRPSHALSIESQADSTAGAPGHIAEQTQPLSLETG
jgi:hypothetical protein